MSIDRHEQCFIQQEEAREDLPPEEKSEQNTGHE
jgi:hypothetical protein